VLVDRGADEAVERESVGPEGIESVFLLGGKVEVTGMVSAMAAGPYR